LLVAVGGGDEAADPGWELGLGHSAYISQPAM